MAMNSEIFESKESLALAIDGFFNDTLDTSRQMNDRVVWRNLLYYCGEHYVEFMRSTGSFRRRTVADFTPTPVSNKIREFVRSIKSMLMNQKMVPRVWPNTNEREDNEAADLGQSFLTWLDQSQDGRFFDEKEKCIIWLCLSGTAFIRSFPDAEGGLWLPDGSKTGDVSTECIIPFNIRMDTLGDTLEKKRWMGIQSLKDREWVEDTFKVKVGDAAAESPFTDYQQRLAKLVSNVSPWKGASIEFQTLDSDEKDRVLFKEVEFRPTKEYKNGRYAIVCGGKLIFIADRLPILTENGQWYYTLTDFHFNYVPGRFWSDPPVNDLISPQNTINEIDQALSINRKGMGRPKLITPGEIGLKKMDMGGHGFLALSYNPIMGKEPKFEQGTPLPPQVLEERRIQEEVFQDSSGDPKNVLKGAQPSANASGVLTDTLRETAERGKYPDMERFNRSLTRVYKKRLLIAQEIISEERLIKMMGRGNKVKISKFKGADLRGNTDVRLELDSGLLSTKSGQAQMLQSMIQNGFFKEGEISPTVKQELMQRMGMATFTDEMNNDTERAEAENMAIASGAGAVMIVIPDPNTGEPMTVEDDPLFEFDNHAIHYETHRKDIISPEFQERPTQAQARAVHHANTHKQRVESEPPDIRDYVQIDKLLAGGILTVSERAQVLDKYLGIKAGPESEAGIPSADTVVKAKQKLMDGEAKIAVKDRQIKADLLKTQMTEEGKLIVAGMNKGSKE
jgi:hypothetical protein